MGNNKTKQSKEQRLERLNEGRCPIHGIGMSQTGNFYYDECSKCGTYKKSDYVVSCPRKDCDMQARCSDTTITLLPPNENLLD